MALYDPSSQTKMQTKRLYSFGKRNQVDELSYSSMYTSHILSQLQKLTLKPPSPFTVNKKIKFDWLLSSEISQIKWLRISFASSEMLYSTLSIRLFFSQ